MKSDAWDQPVTAPVVGSTVPLLDVEPVASKQTSRKRRVAQATHAVACPQPLHPKLAQRRLLPAALQTATGAVSDDVLAGLSAAWDLRAGTSRVINVGTACSGSELYMLSLPPLAERLTALTGCQVSFRHVWACELKPRKRAWIRDNFKPDHLFRDLWELAKGEAVDVAKGEDESHRRLVPVPAVDILIAGFSCKDASRLNIHHKHRLDAVVKGVGTTGSTFEAFMRLS